MNSLWIVLVSTRVSKYVTRLTLQTGKTNALGYELYAFVGEADGMALPLAFMFTVVTDDSVTEGGKERLVGACIRHLRVLCPNILLFLSDKDLSEINACQKEAPEISHQLCSWHAVRYIEQHLSENRPPRPYDPRKANRTFSFIDPTWAPGVALFEETPNLKLTLKPLRSRRRRCSSP